MFDATLALTVAMPDESERACLVAALSRQGVPFMVLSQPQPAVLVLKQHEAVLRATQRTCGETELQTCQTCRHWSGMGEARDVAVRGFCTIASGRPDDPVHTAIHVRHDPQDREAMQEMLDAIGPHLAGPPQLITVFDWRCKGWARLDSQELTGDIHAEGDGAAGDGGHPAGG